MNDLNRIPGPGAQTIRYGMAKCSLGWIIIAINEQGLCAIEFGDDPNTLPDQLHATFPEARLENAGAELSGTLSRVIDFLETPGSTLDLPLDIRGTAFQKQVWKMLREIPPGQTVSYSELAHRIGNPNAVRAVAGACAANKLAAVIPCHRVVRHDGGLSGYRWGIQRKQMLLQREKNPTAVC